MLFLAFDYYYRWPGHDQEATPHLGKRRTRWHASHYSQHISFDMYCVPYFTVGTGFQCVRSNWFCSDVRPNACIDASHLGPDQLGERSETCIQYSWRSIILEAVF